MIFDPENHVRIREIGFMEAQHSLGAEELLQIGISSINAGVFDAGVEWLKLAQTTIGQVHNEDVFMTPDMQNIKTRLREAQKIHDHMLDHRGVVSGTHRCNRLPFNEKLRKKKKFREARLANKTLTERPEKALHLVPLHAEGKDVKEAGLRDNFEHICKGAQMRTAEMDAELRCRLLHHHDPFAKLGPFKMEEASLQPYIMVVRQLMASSEMEHFKATAVNELFRSGHAGKEGQTTSMRRTSKQAWLDHRSFNYSISDLSAVLRTSEAETNKTLRENIGWASIMVRPETLISSDKVLERVSNRMERATKTNLISPVGAEMFQVPDSKKSFLDLFLADTSSHTSP